MMADLFLLIAIVLGIGLPILFGIWPPIVFAIGGAVVFVMSDAPPRMFVFLGQRSILSVLGGYTVITLFFSVFAARLFATLYMPPKGEGPLPESWAAVAGGGAGALAADEAPASAEFATAAPLSQYLSAIAQFAPLAVGPIVVALVSETSIVLSIVPFLILAVVFVFLTQYLGPQESPLVFEGYSRADWSGYLAIPVFSVAVLSGVLVPSEALALSVLWLAFVQYQRAGFGALAEAMKTGATDAGSLIATFLTAYFFGQIVSLGLPIRDMDFGLVQILPYFSLILAAFMGFCGGPIIAVLTIVFLTMPAAISTGVTGYSQFAMAVLVAGEAGRFASTRIGFLSGNKGIDGGSAVWIALVALASVLVLLVDVMSLLDEFFA